VEEPQENATPKSNTGYEGFEQIQVERYRGVTEK
jgi:hypothetical protein